MPGLDRTGPDGQGSQTGRRLGKCNPKKPKTDENLASENTEKPLGRGLGRRKGRGQGRGQGLGNGQGNGQGRRS